MTGFQKAIKYLAMAFAIFLIVSIVGGIAGALGMIGFLGDDNLLDEPKSYSVSEDIKGITLDINAAELNIKIGDEFSVESNLEKLKVEENNNRLSVIEKGGSWFHRTDKGTVTLTIPEDYEFNNADITTGAGVVKIDGLKADNVYIELGAGKADLKNITADSEAEIDGGAGKLTLKDCYLHNLDLDIGVGEFNYSGVITGNSNIDCGVGAVCMDIAGSPDDYSVSVDKGIGEITVDGDSVSDGQTVGNGTNRLEISGGVGSVKIDFAGETK